MPEWPGPRPFVDRRDTLDALNDQLDRALADGGRAVFLLGPEGAGASACLEVFQEEAHRSHRGLRAQYVDCEYSHARTWAEIAAIFTHRHRLGRSLRRVAADWVELVPIAGKILQAVIRTVIAVRGGRVPPPKHARRVASTARTPEESAVEAVRALLEYGGEAPRLIILDSLDRGDAEDLAGVSALFRHLGETRTLFLTAARTEGGSLRSPLGDLLREGERLGRAVRLELPPLSGEEIETALEQALRYSPSSDWVKWITTRSSGLPRKLWSVLGALEERGQLQKRGRRWTLEGEPPQEDWSSPTPAEGLPQLSAEDARLLSLAACEGRIFHTVVLAELADVDELELEDRLAGLRRRGVLAYEESSGDLEQLTSRYRFRNEADVDRLLAGLPEQDRARAEGEVEAIRRRLGLGKGN